MAAAFIIPALISAAATMYAASRPKTGPTGGSGGGTQYTPTTSSYGGRLSDAIAKMSELSGAANRETSQLQPAPQVVAQSTPSSPSSSNPFMSVQTQGEQLGAQHSSPPQSAPLGAESAAGSARALGSPAPDSDVRISGKNSGEVVTQPNSLFTSPRVDATSGINRMGHSSPSSSLLSVQQKEYTSVMPDWTDKTTFKSGLDYFSDYKNNGPKQKVGVDMYSTPQNEGQQGSNWAEYAKLAADLGMAAHEAYRPKPGHVGGSGSIAYNPTVPTSRERLSYMLDAVKRRRGY